MWCRRIYRLCIISQVSPASRVLITGAASCWKCWNSEPITDEVFAFYSETKTKTSMQHKHDAICTKMFCVSKNPIIADVLRACCVNLPICQMSSNENIKLKMTTLAYF